MVEEGEWEHGISIAIPTLNEEEHLPDTLDNLQKRVNELHDSWDVQTMIIDGESEDNTIEIAEEHELVDKIVTVEEKGILWARDAGHIAADKNIVVHIDADTEYKENWLNELIQPFTDPEVAMTYGKVKGKDMEAGLRQVYQKGCRMIAEEYAPGQNRAIRQEAYDRSGGYQLDREQKSAAMTSLEEETRFPNRVKERVGKVVYVEEAECVTSGRNFNSILGGEEKKGGAQWSEVS